MRPNPLRSHGEIAFTLPEAGTARLAIYDVAGRQVAVLTDGVRAAGRHTVPWDGRDTRGNVVPDGVYFVRLETADWVTSRKVVIAR
jgi:flagellar hook assembly protein FlgD